MSAAILSIPQTTSRPSMAEWEVRYRIRLDEPTILLNKWQRMHWSKQKKYQKDLHWLVRQKIDHPPASPLFYSRVHVIRGNPPPRPDHDGLIGGLKPLLDVLQSRRLQNPLGLGFIVDDNPLNMISITADSVVTKPGQGFTEIEIWAPKK